jgi:hypothetical protein
LCRRPPAGILLSGRVLGRAPGSSQSREGDNGGLHYVSWKRDPSLRFFPSRGTYRQKGRIRRWATWPHHMVARLGARPRHPMVSMAPSPLRLIFGIREASVKIGGSAFVSSNSKNISRVAFLEDINSRKQGTGTAASR